MNIRTATRAAAIATALITMSFGATACSSAEGSAGSDTQVYVDQKNGRDVLVIAGDTVSSARTLGTTDDRCGRHDALMAAAKSGKLDPKNVHPGDPNGAASYSDVHIGTMNEAKTSVQWSPESEDDGEVVAIQADTPLEGLVTVDGQIYVPIDNDQGKQLVENERARVCN